MRFDDVEKDPSLADHPLMGWVSLSIVAVVACPLFAVVTALSCTGEAEDAVGGLEEEDAAAAAEQPSVAT